MRSNTPGLKHRVRQLAGEDEEGDEERALAQSGSARRADLHSRRNKDLAVQAGLDETIVTHQQLLHSLVFIRVIQLCDERQMLKQIKN